MCKPCLSHSSKPVGAREVDIRKDSPLNKDDDDDDDDVPLARRLELKRQLRNFKKLKLLFKGRTVASVDPRSDTPLPQPLPPVSSHLSVPSVVSTTSNCS